MTLNYALTKVKLHTLIMYTHILNIKNNDNILLVDNSCKGFLKEPVKHGKKREFNLVKTELDEYSFDYRNTLQKKRKVSISGEKSVFTKELTLDDYITQLYLNYDKEKGFYYHKLEDYIALYEENDKLITSLESKIRIEYYKYIDSTVDFCSREFYEIRQSIYKSKYNLYLLKKIIDILQNN